MDFDLPEEEACIILRLLFFAFALTLGVSAQNKLRGRQLGIPLEGTPGPLNAITDVPGGGSGASDADFRKRYTHGSYGRAAPGTASGDHDRPALAGRVGLLAWTGSDHQHA